MLQNPPSNSCIKLVNSFNELVNTPFTNNNNALGWQRNLQGDFKEIAKTIKLEDNITNVSIKQLKALTLSPEGEIARAIIIEDFELLTQYGAMPNLNLIKCYDRDDALDFIATDVYSYHVDRSPIPTSTFLCTYVGATSDILLNQDAEQMILIPEIRQKLMDLYDEDELSFEAFLEEYFFDLHYLPKPNAKPINLEIGHLWRLAVDNPEQKVLPCIHRAPVENDGEYRLLMIC